MLNKLIKKEKLILIFYAVVLIGFWIVAFVFSNRVDKVIVLVLYLIIPFVVYCFVRLMYRILSINASLKAICFFYYFFLIGGFFGTVMMFVEFISGFPNGLSPTFAACGALIIATLDSAKKNIENETKK